MIPKKIHYCWLSGEELPENVKKCIDSWRKYLPEYEIIEWNTNSFDINMSDYTKEAFLEKKYAFASDYIRLYALYNYGGIYLDSDIEVLKPFDALLENQAFTGFESEGLIAAWIFGSEKNNPLFKEFMDYYTDRHFIKKDGSYDLTPNPVPISNICRKHGMKNENEMQHLKNITIYPIEYFCTKSPIDGKIRLYDESYTIHHFNGGWLNCKARIKIKIKVCFARILGLTFTKKLIEFKRRFGDY